MARTKVRNLTAIVVAGLLLVIMTSKLIIPRESARIVKLATENVAELEAWNFQAKPVRYDLPNHPWARRIEKWLPNSVKQKFGLPKPVLSVQIMPAFPGEPILSAALFIRKPGGGGANLGPLRLVVADDRGEAFDPVVQDANVRDGYWVSEVQAFPRRGRELRLRLVEDNHSLGEFTVPNPARHSYSKWKPEPLPVTVKSNELEFSLVKFRSFQPGAAGFTKDGVHPRTQCVFRARENARDSTAWRPVLFEVSDATGNHWRAWPDSRLQSVNGSEISGGFLGALWAGEDAWKLRVEFRRVAEFPESELLRIVHVPIPGPNEVLQPQIVYEVNGATVGIATIIGSRVDWNRVYQFNPYRILNCVTVLIKGSILSQGKRLVFIEAKDDQGRVVKLAGTAFEPGQIAGQNPDLIPYPFNFKPAADAKELTLVLAVSQSRFVEFLAKPEQVYEDVVTQQK